MASETPEPSLKTERAMQGTIELPAPTAWPITLAFGLTLVFAGLVTSASVSILGAIFTLAGCVGWFRDVLPHQKHESMPTVGTVPPTDTPHPPLPPAQRQPEAPYRAP